MSIHENLKGELKTAMLAKDADKLRAVRNLLAAFTNELVATKMKPSEILPDDKALGVVKRMVKQRKDSIEQFSAGGRMDLVEPEEKELSFLEAMLPETMGKDEIKKIALAKKTEMGVIDKAKMGMLMGAVMAQLKNKADGKDVKEVVESLFS